MPLYGHELTTTRNAAEAGFPRATANEKPFIGHRVVGDPDQQRDALVGIRLEGRRAGREGDAILAPDGTPLGTVTSGSFAPSLGAAIALGYVPRDQASIGNPLVLQTARKNLMGTIVKLPFYGGATARKPLSDFCS
jgi:aminomethyltransferase